MSDEPLARGSNDALDALLLQRFSISGRWSTLLIAGAGLMFQAFSMVVIRAVDGPRAFLDGIVARGVTWFVIGAALPTALGVAKAMSTWPAEPWLLVLARLRGVTSDEVARRTPVAAMRVVGRRAILVMTPLVLLSSLLSLPDGRAALHRAVTGALFVVLAAVSAMALVLIGWAGARWLGGRGRLLIFAALILPAMFTGASRKIPRYLSPTGAYSAANDAVQKLAGR